MEHNSSIPLSEAKEIIISALSAFDEGLGDYAKAIFTDEKRLNIIEERTPKTNMMQVRPAGITTEDLEKLEMVIPDYSEKYGPHFTQQDNPHDYAIIDFEYHSTPESVVHLAHELGHAIADDIQRENDFSFRDFSAYDMEQQAYFVQQIVSNAVREKFGAEMANDSTLNEDLLVMSFDRASAFTTAKQAIDAARGIPKPERNSRVTSFLGLGTR